ncbi:MAG: V-type ATP synthase subunit E family protein [Candidatus Hadarchaeales archaeon]
MWQTEKKDIESVVKDILDQAKKKANEIIEKAEKEAEAILSTAKIQTEKEKIAKLRKAEEEGKSLKEKMIAEEKFKARMNFFSEREKIIDEIFKQIVKKMEKLCERSEYQKWLLEISIKSCADFEDGSVVLRANRRDLKFLNTKVGEISKKSGKAVMLGNPIQAIGGIRIESENGKVAVDQTIESIIERNREKIRMKIAQLLRG